MNSMKIGINGTGLVQRASVDAIAEHAARAADDGFTSYWLAEHPTGGFDALTVLALVGQRVPDIELGTAVVPTWPRHPMVMAAQAATVASAIGGRLTLGIGLSHEPMMAQLGLSFGKPIRHLKEYLSILMPLLRDGKVEFKGESIECQAQMFRAPSARCQVVVAALGPQALKVAGRLADGVSLAWVGPKTIRSHIVPRLHEVRGTGSPARVIATLPICVTGDPAGVRSAIDRNLAMYATLPSYRAMFEKEGVSAPSDVALVGSEAEVQDKLEVLAESGVTDFSASEFTRTTEERSATRTFLIAENGRR